MEGEGKDKLKERRRPFRVQVRLSPEEWARISADEELLRWEKATILRAAYFSGLPTTVLMDKESEQKFLAEFNRIGNNINQLARCANSGGVVSDQKLSEVQEQFRILYRFVMRFDGIR